AGDLDPVAAAGVGGDRAVGAGAGADDGEALEGDVVAARLQVDAVVRVGAGGVDDHAAGCGGGIGLEDDGRGGGAGGGGVPAEDEPRVAAGADDDGVPGGHEVRRVLDRPERRTAPAAASVRAGGRDVVSAEES